MDAVWVVSGQSGAIEHSRGYRSGYLTMIEHDCERISCECRYWFNLAPSQTVYHRALWYYADPYPDDGGWIDNSDGPPMARFKFYIPIAAAGGAR